jgi:tRNA dimethylallyltransferase
MHNCADKKRVFCLAGPTACGKSDLVLGIAEKHDIEVVSVDSVSVYRGMDIGAAKPSADVLRKMPHHLIDICDPKEAYCAAQFCKDAKEAIDGVLLRNRLPLLVGGTMLYYRALLMGLAPLPAANHNVRKMIADRALKEGWGVLHQELSQLDPQAGARIHQNDPQRIQRALEICLSTGKSVSTQFENTQKTFDDSYDVLMLGLMPEDRTVLHARIEKRFHDMLAQGFIDEVALLRGRGDLSPDLPAFRAVGYKQVWKYLDGSINYDQMVGESIAATRQLAKRQLTWLRNWPNLSIFDCFNSNLLSKVLTLM